MNQPSTMRCQVTKYEVSLLVNCSKIAIISSATTVTQHDALCPILDKKINFAPFFWRAIGSDLKCVINAKIRGKLVQRPLEALGEPHNHSKASKFTKTRLEVKQTQQRPPQRGQDFWPSLPSHLLQSIKIDKKLDLKSNTPNKDHPISSSIFSQF